MFCKLRGNPYVELVHWLHQLVQLPDSDLHRIIKHFNLDPARLARDLTESLDRLPRGSTSISDLSSHIEEAVERGWVYGSLLFQDRQVRTGYLLVGMVKTRSLALALTGISKEFQKVKADELADNFAKIVGGSPEEKLAAADGSQLGGATPGEASGALPPAQLGKQEALRRFAVDLTERARKGEIDPIVGRDEEIRQIVDILMRRRQNNPILTGEAGVGKTAVVEGFAPADRRRRRAASAQGRLAAVAGYRAAAGRREHEGRVRAAAAAGDRGSAGLGEADHPVRGRGPHADRRRRRGRHRRRRQPAQTGPGPRHAADGRRHHLGRVQEAH